MSALFWLLRRSFRNWIVFKVTRLKKPKYAVSALLLGLYLCMILLPWATGAADFHDADDLRAARASGQAFAAGMLLVSVAWAWILGSPGALAFTMPEATFLFPAPVSRRALLVMKIARTQLPVLISSAFVSFARSSAGHSTRWPVLATSFVVFEAVFLNRLAAALAQCPRPATGKPHWTAHAGKALLVLVLVLVAVSFRPVRIQPEPSAILGALADWANREPARWALAPFRAFGAPLAAHSPRELLAALVAPLGILAGLLAAVLGPSVPFEETAIVQSETLKQKIDLIRRTGKLRQAKGKVRPAPIALRASGGPVVALAWKNYLAISRLPLTRAALYFALALLGCSLVPRFEETRFLSLPIAFVVAWAAAMATLIGPDAMRADLRVSLRRADFLKTLPVSGWRIFLGEILAGPLVLIAIQGALLALAALLVRGEVHSVPVATLAWAWLAAVIFLFPIDLLIFTIANGAAVVFPQWVQLGPQPERGAEAIGQNFLVNIVRYLVIAIGVFPAGIVAGIVGAVGYAFAGGPALPAAALLGALVVSLEVGALVWWLGGALDRLDPSAEPG